MQRIEFASSSIARSLSSSKEVMLSIPKASKFDSQGGVRRDDGAAAE